MLDPEISPTLSEWQRRLDGQLRANLIGDLIGQFFLAFAYHFYSSPWVIVLWLTRWVVLGALWLGRRKINSPDPSSAVFTVIAGHLIGALLATLIVPVFGALTVLIVIGDLQMWSDYIGTTSHIGYRRLATASVGVLSLLTLWDPTGVADHAPEWLLLAFLLGHSVGISLLIARQSWGAIDVARRQSLELALSRRRLQLAEIEARRGLSESIAGGPRRQLAEVRRLLRAANVESQRPEADESVVSDALDLTESVVDELRELGHGLLVPELASQDLSVAMASVRWPESSRLRIIASIDPSPPLAVRQAMVGIASELASWARQHDSSVETVLLERSGDSVAVAIILVSTASPSAISQLRTLLRDLAGAAGGEIRVTTTGAGLEVTGSVPEHADDAAPPPETPSGDPHVEALAPYLRGSLLLSTAGLVLIVLLSWSSATSLELAVLGGLMLLTIALLALASQRLQHGETLQTIAITTAASTLIPCGVVVLLPTMSSALVIFTILPLMVAPSITGDTQFIVICVVQQAAAAFILTVAVSGPPTHLTETLPGWLVGGALFVIPVAVAFLLLRVDRATKASLQRDIGLLRSSRAEIVTASRMHRRELERDLHDGAQQVVVALAAQLRVFLRRLARTPTTARAMMPRLLKAAVDADTALTDFSAGNYPSLLIERGLDGGLRQLAAMCPHRTIVDLDLPRELPAAVELTLYYCCSEALQNAAKHAGAGASVHVMVRDRGDVVQFEITDDGRGYDRRELTADGRGLANIEVRVKRLLGDVEVDAAIGRGCAVRAWLPVDPVPVAA